MHREIHGWHSPRLGRDTGVVVYGHWGPPVLAFPTSGGDEWEMEGQGLIAVTTMGMSLGAYHAANTLLKHPDAVKRCFALSGVYDLSNFMDGMYDDNFYFNNPVHYIPNLNDPSVFEQLASCDIHL